MKNDSKVAQNQVAAATPEPKKSKKPLIITLIIAGVLVLAGIGWMIWWFAYYSSDNKVLTDAFHNTLSTTEGTNETKITAKITNDGSTASDVNIEANIKSSFSGDAIALDIDGKVSASAVSISASANLVIHKNGEVYIKINYLDKLLSNLGLTSDLLGGFDASKVSDKWIKISQDDLENLIPQTEINTNGYAKCVESAVTTLTEKKDTQKELLDIIKDSQVLTAKRVGSDQDGIKFKLTGDINAAATFANKLVSMEIFQAFSSCVAKLSTDTVLDSTADLPDWDDIVSQVNQLRSRLGVEVHFWVNASNHQPTRLLVSVESEGVELSLDTTSKADKPEVTIPSDSTSLTSIIQSTLGSTDLYNETINYDNI
jgi:hypothetical protein